jgi:hypothetical protein
MKDRQLCAFDMKVDDLADQGRPFLYLLQEGQMRRQCPPSGARQRPGVSLENSYQQVIQVIQVVLALLPQRFLATIKAVQFQPWSARPSRCGLGAAQLGLARGRPFDGAELCIQCGGQNER